MKLNNLFLPILFIGICLFTYSLHVNKITEKNLSELKILFDQNKITLDEFNDLYEETVSLRTKISNIANGLLSFSICGFVFCKILRVKRISDFKGIKTLNKLNIFILSNVLWVLFLFGSCFYYYYKLWRGDYSPYKDSIMIEIEISIITYFFWLIPLNLFYLLFLSQTKLPTIISVKLSKLETIKIKILFLILWMIILFEFLSLISAIWGGDLFSIILSIIYIYILFSIRAGIINKHIN